MKQVAVGIALVDTHGRVDAEEVFAFIESNSDDFQTYRPAPPRPGSIRLGALNYMLLLTVTSSVASIASLLWMAYNKFIAPKKDKTDSAGIVVIIRKDDGTNDQYWIGNTDKSKEIFIQTFSASINSIRHSKSPGQSTEQAEEELRIESLWIRRK